MLRPPRFLADIRVQQNSQVILALRNRERRMSNVDDGKLLTVRIGRKENAGQFWFGRTHVQNDLGNTRTMPDILAHILNLSNCDCPPA
jgi:hypothetical protein